MIKKAVILAGGSGTRFLPATLGLSKEMFPILDKPVLFYILKECLNSGITQALIISNKQKKDIIKFLYPNKKFINNLHKTNKIHILQEYYEVINNLTIDVVFQKKLTGTAGALQYAKKWVNNSPFMVFNGDDFFDCEPYLAKQLIQMYSKTNKNICVIQQVKQQLIPLYGIAKLEYKNKGYYTLKQIVEKPLLQNAPSNYAVLGRYIFNAEIFDYLKLLPCHNGEYYTTDAINLLAQQNKCIAMVLNGKYFDCGNKLEFIKCFINVSLKDTQYGNLVAEYLKSL